MRHDPKPQPNKAAEKELVRLRQLKAVEAAAGSWKDKDHPELKQGAMKWVDKLRRQDEKRYRKVAARYPVMFPARDDAVYN